MDGRTDRVATLVVSGAKCGDFMTSRNQICAVSLSRITLEVGEECISAVARVHVLKVRLESWRVSVRLITWYARTSYQGSSMKPLAPFNVMR